MLRRSTVESRYGTLSQREFRAVVRFHRALLEMEKNGIPVNKEMLDKCEQVAEGAGRKKEVTTIQALNRRTKNGRIYPKYDMFKSSGRSFIYQEYPNIPPTLPPTIFSIPENSVPVYLSKEDPISSIEDAVFLLDEDYVMGPMVGSSIYFYPKTSEVSA